jgi:hypothetical protein
MAAGAWRFVSRIGEGGLAGENELLGDSLIGVSGGTGDESGWENNEADECRDG